MSLLDIRQNSLLDALFRLENAKKEEEKKRILQEIQAIFLHQSQEKIFSSLQQYFKFKKDSPEEKAINEKIAKYKLLNDSLTIGFCQELLEKFQENDALKKNAEYTKYLMACEEYKRKTGEEPSHDKDHSIDTKTESTVSSASEHKTPVPHASVEAEKSPVFIDKRQYADGGVTIYRGLKPGELERINKEIADKLNAEKPGSVTFQKTENGFTVQADEAVFSEFKRLENEALNNRYQLFSHVAEKHEKNIPEKYHSSSKEEEKKHTSRPK